MKNKIYMKENTKAFELLHKIISQLNLVWTLQKTMNAFPRIQTLPIK